MTDRATRSHPMGVSLCVRMRNQRLCNIRPSGFPWRGWDARMRNLNSRNIHSEVPLGCSLWRPRPILVFLALSLVICPFPAILSSILTFLAKICHHHHHHQPLQDDRVLLSFFLAHSIICLFPPIAWGAPSIITFLTKVCCFRICCVVLQVVYRVLTVWVLNNLRVKWYIWKFPSTKCVLNL